MGEEGRTDVALPLDRVLRQTPGVRRQGARRGNLPEGLGRFFVDLGGCRGGSNRVHIDVAVGGSTPEAGEERDSTESVRFR